jgi:hypothetical protein
VGQAAKSSPSGEEGVTVRALSVLLWAALAAMTLTIPASAQTMSSSQFFQGFNGVNPRNVTFSAIDTTKAMQTMNVNSAFRPSAQQKPFNLTNILPKVSMPSWPPKVATPTILPQKSNPFQPNPIYGKNPFDQTPVKK